MILEEQIDSTGERYTLAPLLLGMAKMLDDFAVQIEAGQGQPHPIGVWSAVDERMLYACLGALSVRRTVRRWLALAAADSLASEHPAPVPSSSGRIDFLR